MNISKIDLADFDLAEVTFTEMALCAIREMFETVSSNLSQERKGKAREGKVTHGSRIAIIKGIDGNQRNRWNQIGSLCSISGEEE